MLLEMFGVVVRAVLLSHQVMGSKQLLHIYVGRLASAYPFTDATHVGASSSKSAQCSLRCAIRRVFFHINTKLQKKLCMIFIDYFLSKEISYCQD
ncbi:hypothetical protein ZEAMMB73_Zm00001d052620 [Zea mays]|jgi:hypothetical protein|uniref:Uncharacterized protein n=1 Tax=Zea mays TaxID=4577 RepID=A0A1D6QI13_MAIZE|nr:hypothetical protein ZEAMMB73_Zm00001d052620 [Zea mays]